MLVNSFSFVVFFVIAAAVYFALSHRTRWIALLCASYYFYLSFKPEYLLLILLSTIVNYICGIRMGRIEAKPKRKAILIGNLIFNMGVLFLFKYFNFFNDSVRALFERYHLFYGVPALKFLLPLGISFYTFKNMSYAIEVYRGTLSPENHLGRFALYVSFFPQILAGPIERAAKFLPQLHQRVDFDYQRIADGLRLMLWGFFQKMVVADTLATLVDSVYGAPTRYQGVSFTLAAIFYTYQIYYDFAGYSDIAIGAAKVLGFDTTLNFDRPYSSKSISEFWRRWHITLSSWFRDYLYIPLGGNRVSSYRWGVNILVTFLLCGLWHGADWTYLIWGGMQGFYIVFSKMTHRLREGMAQSVGLVKIPRFAGFLKVVITFLLFSFSLIFFRSESLSQAGYIISHLLTGWKNLVSVDGFWSAIAFGPSKFEWVVGLVSLGAAQGLNVAVRQGNVMEGLSKKPIFVRWSAYYVMVVGILLLGQFGTKQFIYFQF
jgi:alginate O-acetyltransferase complex protein AlgI